MHKYFSIPYVNNGRDFKGCDCFGLVKLMLKEEEGICIPDFIYNNAQDDENTKFYNQELNNPKWIKCKPAKGAVVVLRIDGIAKHVGYMLDDTYFAHITKETGVSIARVDDIFFQTRIVGFWRYS